MIFVDARHLDYTSCSTMLECLGRVPDFGHAWIRLYGNGEVIEGGHSGESGKIQAKYFDGVMNYIEYGYANPNEYLKKKRRYETNPIKYLWASQYDGFFEKGSGNHKPTYQIKINLTEDKYKAIKSFIDPKNYNYRDYAITRNQCSSFVAQVASIAGIELEYEITIPIEQCVRFGGRTYQLWTDPQYSTITISSPDVLEKSLIRISHSFSDNLDNLSRHLCPQ